MELYILWGILAAVMLLAALQLAALRSAATRRAKEKEEGRREADAREKSAAAAMEQVMRGYAALLDQAQQQTRALQDRRLSELKDQLKESQQTLQGSVDTTLKQLDARMLGATQVTEQKLEAMRQTLNNQLLAMAGENEKKLEAMRATVDEKLQKTLEERLGHSFRVVSERLEQVYKGLGEMQTLASGVGDLKKVLSNVKTRGVLGEVQLGSILEEILPPGQYEKNVATKRGSAQVVEFAVKLPGDGDAPVYLPIDAKFPLDAYTQLLDAYDAGDGAAVEAMGKQLEARVRSFARDIHSKYVDVPNTTDFAILFLPFEGLYAEVVRRGLFETLQRESKVSIAGPTTMAAILSSLQMGFRTLAIQKRSSEVWQVLGAVKTEFEKFAGVLSSAQKRLEQAHQEIDALVGVRTRQIQRRLQSVTALPEEESAPMLSQADWEEEGEA